MVGDSIVPSCRRASTYPYDVQVAGCWVNILLNSFLEMTTTGGYFIVYSLVRVALEVLPTALFPSMPI